MCIYSRYFAIQSICEKHPEEEEKELVFIGVCDLWDFLSLQPFIHFEMYYLLLTYLLI